MKGGRAWLSRRPIKKSRNAWWTECQARYEMVLQYRHRRGTRGVTRHKGVQQEHMSYVRRGRVVGAALACRAASAVAVASASRGLKPFAIPLEVALAPLASATAIDPVESGAVLLADSAH